MKMIKRLELIRNELDRIGHPAAAAYIQMAIDSLRSDQRKAEQEPAGQKT